jgi:hypothetical protein
MQEVAFLFCLRVSYNRPAPRKGFAARGQFCHPGIEFSCGWRGAQQLSNRVERKFSHYVEPDSDLKALLRIQLSH